MERKVQMVKSLVQLIILFFVIFDPLASFSVFISATARMSSKQRNHTARLAIFVALVISLTVLLLGERLLELFSTNIDDFRVAGGIILGILGMQMALGQALSRREEAREDSATAIAAIIGTPLLTGPAAITAIIVSVGDYGMLVTGVAVAVVLAFTALIFLQASRIKKYIGRTPIQVLSTILGLITLAWGVKFIRTGLGV